MTLLNLQHKMLHEHHSMRSVISRAQARAGRAEADARTTDGSETDAKTQKDGAEADARTTNNSEAEAQARAGGSESDVRATCGAGTDAKTQRDGTGADNAQTQKGEADTDAQIQRGGAGAFRPLTPSHPKRGFSPGPFFHPLHSPSQPTARAEQPRSSCAPVISTEVITQRRNLLLPRAQRVTRAKHNHVSKQQASPCNQSPTRPSPTQFKQPKTETSRAFDHHPWSPYGSPRLQSGEGGLQPTGKNKIARSAFLTAVGRRGVQGTQRHARTCNQSQSRPTGEPMRSHPPCAQHHAQSASPALRAGAGI